MRFYNRKNPASQCAPGLFSKPYRIVRLDWILARYYAEHIIQRDAGTTCGRLQIANHYRLYPNFYSASKLDQVQTKENHIEETVL